MTDQTYSGYPSSNKVEHTTYTLESDKLYNELEEKAEMKAKAKFYCVRVEKYET